MLSLRAVWHVTTLRVNRLCFTRQTDLAPRLRAETIGLQVTIRRERPRFGLSDEAVAPDPFPYISQQFIEAPAVNPYQNTTKKSLFCK